MPVPLEVLSWVLRLKGLLEEVKDRTMESNWQEAPMLKASGLLWDAAREEDVCLLKAEAQICLESRLQLFSYWVLNRHREGNRHQ